MERFVRRLMDREDGLAMVSAIIVSFLVVAFGVALVQLSLHNSESSAVDRGRVGLGFGQRIAGDEGIEQAVEAA